MNKLIMSRGTGKTTRLVQESAKRQIPIVCPTDINAKIILQRAKELNLQIPNPIPVLDLKIERHIGVGDILVDDADLCFAMFLSNKYRANPQMITISPT